MDKSCCNIYCISIPYTTPSAISPGKVTCLYTSHMEYTTPLHQNDLNVLHMDVSALFYRWVLAGIAVENSPLELKVVDSIQ